MEDVFADWVFERVNSETRTGRSNPFDHVNTVWVSKHLEVTGPLTLWK